MENQFNRQVEKPSRIILGMGCFWGPDSKLGSLPGTGNTLAGYSGGTAPSPTYRKIGDHTETVEVTFDPHILSTEALLHFFWKNHDAGKDRFYKERQYISLLVCENEEQAALAQKIMQEEEEKLGRKLQTEIQLQTPFYPAEDYHQKYFLRRFKKAAASVQALFPTEEAFVRSTIAARLNGFVRENVGLAEIKEEIKTWGLAEEDLHRLQAMLDGLKW